MVLQAINNIVLGKREFGGYYVNQDGRLTDQRVPITGEGPAVGPAGKLRSIRKVLSAWRNVNFKSISSSVRYHLNKHGQGNSVYRYTDDAIDLFKKYKSTGKEILLKDGSRGMKIKGPDGRFGIYDS